MTSSDRPLPRIFGTALALRPIPVGIPRENARNNSGVRGRVERAESDAALVEDDEDIATAQVVEAGGEARAIGRGAGGVILEHALAAGGVQGVELSVEDLAAIGRGDAGDGFRERHDKHVIA